MNFDEWVILRLRAHGAYEGVVDAVPGRQMVLALERFQRAIGLKVNGLANELTVAALRSQPGAPKEKIPAPVFPAEPVWMREARRFMGLREIAGSKSDPTIMGWAKRLGGWISSFYTNDDIPWCGLAMAHWIGVTLPREPLPSNPLSALAWKKFGRALSIPALGAILVFTGDGGGHVGQYDGEDATHYYVLGANQQNPVSVTRIEKRRCVGVYWPLTGGDPVGGRVFRNAAGVKVSSNEA